MDRCPCCGAEIEYDNSAARLLRPQEYLVFTIVSEARGRKVNMGVIIEYVWGGQGEPNDPEAIVRILVHRINKAFGRKIISAMRGRGNGGYFLDLG